MDFVKNNIEKLVMALLLIVFCWLLIGFKGDISAYKAEAANKNVSEAIDKAKKAKKAYSKSDANAYMTSKSLEKKAAVWGDFEKGRLMTPKVYVSCWDVEEDKAGCKHLVSMSEENCTFCSKFLGDIAKGPKKAPADHEDRDGDGIPFGVEKKYDFLSDAVEQSDGWVSADPNDVLADHDGDGFTTITEYKAKTDFTNPKSHPSLVNLLSVYKIEAKSFGIKVDFVNDNGTEDKKKWEVQAKVKQGSRWRLKLANIGDTIESQGEKFVVKDIARKTKKVFKKSLNEDVTVTYYVIDLLRKYSEGGEEVEEPFRITAGTGRGEVIAQDKTVTLVYYSNGLKGRKRIVVQGLEEFSLGNSTVGREKVNVISVGIDSVKVKSTLPGAKEVELKLGEVPTEYNLFKQKAAVDKAAADKDGADAGNASAGN